MVYEVRNVLSMRDDGATSTILVVDGVHVLLDCGMTDNTHVDRYDRVSE